MFFNNHKKYEWLRHSNPDGSKGGLITPSSIIGKDVVIAATATVMPGVNVPDRTIIEHGSVYTDCGTIRFDD